MGMKKCLLCKQKPANKRMSKHHLRPKYVGHIDGKLVEGTKRSGKIATCKSCHETVHYYFSNEELYTTYNTLEKLKAGLVERLIDETFGPFMFAIENGAVVPTPERLFCKQKAAGESPVSASTELQPELHFAGIEERTPEGPGFPGEMGA